MNKTLAVVGLGKLGAPVAACFAAKGFRVIAVDSDPHKVAAINHSSPPVFEPGLAELLRAAQGRLTAAILIALPPFMMVMMGFLNPGYIKPLFTDPWGPWILLVAAGLQIVGTALLWKIVNIEV